MGKKIMVVDDTPDTLEVTKEILEMNKFDVKTFDKADAALKAILKGYHPDLLLLDMRMPEISGQDFCTELKKNKLNDKIKVVFFTASSELDKELAKENGALGFIFKPFSMEGIVKEINKYLKMK